MIRFKDYYQNEVLLSFDDHPFSKHPKHVWVICTYNHKWLLTRHRDRGFEFPGGKVENGETPLEAAKREVLEETGGIVQNIQYFGQYKVLGKEKTIVKNIYIAEVERLLEQNNYFETDGPMLLTELPPNIEQDSRFSFIMKDGVLTHSLSRMKKLYNLT